MNFDLYSCLKGGKKIAACYLSTAAPYIIGLPSKLLKRHSDNFEHVERKGANKDREGRKPKGAAVSSVLQT